MKVWEFMTISENPPPWKRSCNKVQHHLNLQLKQCLMRPSIFRIIWFAHYLPHMPYYLKSTKNLSNLQAPLWVQVDDMLKWTVTFSFLQASMDGQVMATQQYKKLLGSPPAPILGFRFVIPICYSCFFKLQVPNWLFQHFSNWIFSQIWCGFCHQNPQLHRLIVFVSWFVCFCSVVHSLTHPLEICLKRLFFLNFPTVAYFPLKGNTATIMSAIKNNKIDKKYRQLIQSKN